MCTQPSAIGSYKNTNTTSSKGKSSSSIKSKKGYRTGNKGNK